MIANIQDQLRQLSAAAAPTYDEKEAARASVDQELGRTKQMLCDVLTGNASSDKVCSWSTSGALHVWGERLQHQPTDVFTSNLPSDPAQVTP